MVKDSGNSGYQAADESTNTTPLLAPPPYAAHIAPGAASEASASSTPAPQSGQYMGPTLLPPPGVSVVHHPGGHYYVASQPGVSTGPIAYQQQYPQMPVPSTLLVQAVHINTTNQPVGYQVVDGRMFISASEPVRMYCPYDHCQVVTVVEHNPGCFTYATAAFLCCVFWPAFCLPFCIERCQVTLSFL
ncbi:hypothetical protein BSLG_004018 [Batrachochytrium salamandrivorans]|nr:hypothetical protein BSLG_004018 [Batrachochytrium salamandrivorans]